MNRFSRSRDEAVRAPIPNESVSTPGPAEVSLLKYPLPQTMERGNLAGFKRISWDEALDRVRGNREDHREKEELGYIPRLGAR